MLEAITVGAVLLVVAVLWVLLFNSLTRSRNEVDNWRGQMQVFLQKRHDLVPNLVESVKGYATHEALTLERVTLARNEACSVPAGSEAAFKAERALSGALLNLKIVSERYPDLKADARFQELMGQLRSTEDDLARARQYYNDSVKRCRDQADQYPGRLIAGNVFRGGLPPYFEAEAAAQTAPRISM